MKDSKSDRDSSMEQLLHRHMKTGEAAASTGACLNADTLAAWAEGTLTAAERVAGESHAADCVRCQALLAAMAKTTPVVDAAPWWRRPLVAWIAPAVAVGAALVVWAIVPNRRALEVTGRTAPVSSVAATSNTTSPPAPSSTLVVQPVVPAPAEPDVRRNLSAKDARGDTSQMSLRRFRRDETKQDESSALEKRQAGSSRRREAVEERVATPVAPPAAPPAPIAGAAAAQAREAVAAGVVGGVADRTSAREMFAAAKVAPAASFVVFSPEPASRWRVSNGTVQRSTDAGSTWHDQPVAVAATLAGGAAPSATVCWLVGRSGVVLLSVDGQSWRTVSPIAGADLVSIRAVDDKTATVTASDGRTFTTNDGGATWTRP